MSYDQKKIFSRWRRPPSWILKILILVTWLLSASIAALVYQILSKSDDFSLRYGDLGILQNGGRPPFWICYDVTILHRRTHFRCPNIVLKFLVDRCCSFRDTCHKTSFWLYITDHGNFGVAHALYHVTLSRGVQNNHSYDPYLPIHYATFMRLRWRLRGVLSSDGQIRIAIQFKSRF